MSVQMYWNTNLLFQRCDQFMSCQWFQQTGHILDRQHVCSSVFQALGHGVLSLTVSVVRQLLVLLPVAFVLSRFRGLQAVWWAFPIAELFSLTLSTLFLKRVYHKEILPMREIGE